jgi:hypothetical protein
MLVNANDFPGPALWQGLMFIAAIPTAILAFSGKTPDQQWLRAKIAAAAYVAFGIALFAVIVFL